MARLTRRERVGSRVRSWATTVLRFWFSLQITQFGGQYSIERLLAPEEYTRKTSLSRVLLVLVVSPLPTLTIALCQSPFHCKVRPKGGRLSSRGSFSARAMMVAAFWVFPIPFINTTLALLWILAFAVAFYAVAGAEVVGKILKLTQRQRLRTFNNFSTVQIVMVCIYPVYQVLFDVANHTQYELPVLLVLPLLKNVLKSVFASTILDMEDTIPEEATFTIDFFDALYHKYARP
ncbi:hypothetical protein PF005_g7944 [Phytophthora fragariae]|uniref:Uncharacterized protein n=4 Tax=Phytophthora TaxID=4783 RepID=A0A6A3YJ32_9STRA|nr:hypothetical protein PF005_g7944 [Phytophthora fragariae]KAE9316718.1 hypothetical protein PF001_g7193 [Phytophthora fragariae]